LQESASRGLERVGEVARSARTIAEHAPGLLGLFENQTLIAESRSKPEIWSNWDDFVAKSEALTSAASALVEAAESGGFAAGRPLVRGVRESCGGCHRPYRAPDAE
jgi:cytochrome c556